MKHLLLCLLLLLLLPLPVWAASPAEEVYAILQRLSVLLAPRAAPQVYYVSPGGSNSHSCDTARSASTPKATLNGPTGGLACLASGDTLILKDGQYTEQIADAADSEHPGTTRPPSGTSWSRPTTLRAEHPLKATLLLPPGNLSHVVSFGLPDTRDIALEGLVIDGTGRSTCVWFGPSSPLRLVGSHVKRCGNNGVYVDLTTGVELIGNLIEDVAMTQGSAPPGNHSMYYVGAQGRIAGNVIRGCPFLGIQARSEHGGLHDNVIENNRVIGCAQSGICSQGAGTIIRHNLLEGTCIGISLSSAPTAVLHNTIYGARTGPNCSDSYGIFDKSGGSTIGNNLLLQQHMAIYSMTTPTLTTNMCDGNGMNCQIKVPSASAVVVDGPGGNLTLATGSPAKDAATPTSAVPLDRLGVTRPQGARSDIGAYEATGSAPPPTGDTTPPTVRILAPSDQAIISGTSVALSAETTDNVKVVGLQFSVGGQPQGPVQCCVTVDLLIDSTLHANGAYELTAEAWDAAGNTTMSAPVRVTIYNGPTPPDPGPTPRPPLVLSCTGTLAAVPGSVALQCLEQREGRR